MTSYSGGNKCLTSVLKGTERPSVSEELEDTKGLIRIRKSKNRQHIGRKKKDKRTNNDLQNITHKTKDRVKRTH
jgi:hypothetical protein